MPKNFINLAKTQTMNQQVTPSRRNIKKSMPKYIKIKNLKTKVKEKILKAAR